MSIQCEHVTHSSLEKAVTYVVGDMDDTFRRFLMCNRDEIGKVALIDLDIDLVCRTKSHNLHVISVCTSPGHLLKVAFKDTFYLLGCRCNKPDRC